MPNIIGIILKILQTQPNLIPDLLAGLGTALKENPGLLTDLVSEILSLFGGKALPPKP